MGLVGQRKRLAAGAGGNLKYVAVVVAVVGDHVEHVDPFDPHARQVQCTGIFD